MSIEIETVNCWKEKQCHWLKVETVNCWKEKQCHCLKVYFFDNKSKKQFLQKQKSRMKEK